MSTRTGFLSDENMKKMCSIHRPVPMDRMDLLPQNPINTSGLYMRKLKDPPILKRPAKASSMLNSVERMTGRDVSASYVEQLEKRIDRQPIRMLSRQFGGVDQQTYTNLSSVPNVADEMYKQSLEDLGLFGFAGEQFGDLESLPASEVPATIATYTEAEPETEEPATTAEIGTETRRSQGEYLVEFLRKSRTQRERTIRLILQKYRNNNLVSPVPNIPTQPSKLVTEQIFREFLDDIYEGDYEFDLDELLQIPTGETMLETLEVAEPLTLSVAETGLA